MIEFKTKFGRPLSATFTIKDKLTGLPLDLSSEFDKISFAVKNNLSLNTTSIQGELEFDSDQVTNKGKAYLSISASQNRITPGNYFIDLRFFKGGVLNNSEMYAYTIVQVVDKSVE
jgi:hypothetical protein